MLRMLEGCKWVCLPTRMHLCLGSFAVVKHVALASDKAVKLRASPNRVELGKWDMEFLLFFLSLGFLLVLKFLPWTFF